ncbi:MAG: hypothetical protein J4G05_00330 [Chlorobi bacterium]|nr:hypothetical protein [Chlorobiota bacterium]
MNKRSLSKRVEDRIRTNEVESTKPQGPILSEKATEALKLAQKFSHIKAEPYILPLESMSSSAIKPSINKTKLNKMLDK